MNAPSDREPRYSVDLIAAVTLGDEVESRPARVSNVSRRGLCLEDADGSARAKLDGFVGVEVQPGPDNGRIVLFGVVRWVRDGRIGLEIGGMHPHHRGRHSSLLDSLGA